MKKGGDDFSSFGDSSLESIFAYFASEIFQKADADTQAFLLKTAFSPYMDMQMAESITAAVTAKRILTDLVRNNYFTERRRHPNPIYQYHPLFREFLLSQTRDFFNNEDIRRLQQKTAGIVDSSASLDWRDSWLYKAGVEYKADKALALRAGYVYVQSPVPDDTLDPSNPDSDMHNINLGFGYTFDKIVIDFFYDAGCYEDRKVDNDILDGEYSNFVHYTGVSVGYGFQ